MSDQHDESDGDVRCKKPAEKRDQATGLLKWLRRAWPAGRTAWLAKALAWVLILAGLLAWVAVAGSHHWMRASLLTALAAAAFILGALVGFIFTTYDEESATVGKLKDWLLGAIATLTLVKFSALQPMLVDFTLHGSRNEFALAVSVAVVFLGVGFFFMFFGRELFFNVPLARSRHERNRIETGQASAVTLQLLAAIPNSLLLGQQDVGSVLRDRPSEAAKLRRLLYSSDVSSFLKQSDDAIRESLPLPWDVVSKNAYLLYYRTYFADPDDKQDAAEVALSWISRARVIDPIHLDLTIKQVDTLSILERYAECVEMLRGIHGQNDCPPFVDEWLGYFLLKLPERAQQSVRCSSRYLRSFPHEAPALLNLARAYAQLVCSFRGATNAEGSAREQHFDAMMNTLRELLAYHPDYKAKVCAGANDDDPKAYFRCVLHRAEFRHLLGLAKVKPGAEPDGAKPRTPLHPRQNHDDTDADEVST